MARRWWTIGLGSTTAIVALTAVTLWARQGTVYTLDGGSFSGDVTDDGQYVRVRVHGIQTRIDKRNIAGNIVYPPSMDKQYADRHSVLNPYDVDGREALANYCLENGRADLAVKALTEAVKIDPENRKAAQALQGALAQEQLNHTGHATTGPTTAAADKGKAAPTTAPSKPASGATVAGQAPTTAPAEAVASTKPAAPPPPAPPPPPPPPHRLLNNQEVNIIRQHALESDDHVHVKFDNDVTARFAKDTGRNLAEFRRSTPVDQAMAILAEGTPKMAGDVRIMTDPQSIVTFRDKVLPIIMAGCAASGCHDGMHGGSFGLYRGTSPNVLYTNFYILQTYAKTINGVQYLAMDRNYPDRSLVLQFNIPPHQAILTHPNVPDYRARLRGTSDPKYKTIDDWLTSLRPIEPHYGMDVSPSIPVPPKSP